MSRFAAIAISFVLAMVATVFGWSQSLNFKIVPEVPLACWFPIVAMTDMGEVAMVTLSLIQFPMFALAFTIGIRRWSIARVITFLTCTYASLVGIALAILGLK